MKYVVAVLAIALGVVGVVAGGVDDSPGFQLVRRTHRRGGCRNRQDCPAQQVARTGRAVGADARTTPRGLDIEILAASKYR
jgi:hypothetical protein